MKLTEHETGGRVNLAVRHFLSISLALSSFKMGVSPLKASNEGKILRKPATTDPISSPLILIGASCNTRRRGSRSEDEDESSSRGSTEIESRSSRRFVVLKWISRLTRFSQWVEKETREETVVRHELAEHTHPNKASLKRGSAVAISSISSSVKPKIHPPVVGQTDSSKRYTSPWNSMMGAINAVLTETCTEHCRVVSFWQGP